MLYATISSDRDTPYEKFVLFCFLLNNGSFNTLVRTLGTF